MTWGVMNDCWFHDEFAAAATNKSHQPYPLLVRKWLLVQKY
jgi:hypothetical protein